MRSMTGFGSGSAPFDQGRLTVEMHTVNHRFLEVRARTPREFFGAEALLEKLVRKRLSRGYCTINLAYEGGQGGSAQLDKPALKTHLESLITVAKEMELVLTDLVPLLAGAPDLFHVPHPGDRGSFAQAVETAFTAACAELIAMRDREGAVLTAKIRTGIEHVETICRQFGECSEENAAQARGRTKERIEKSISTLGLALDHQRVAAETVLLLDRLDISEEIIRLGSHCQHLGSLLETSEPVGRRIDFILQEFGRETNTVGAKSSSEKISHLVVDLKTELEKIRELAQNVE